MRRLHVIVCELAVHRKSDYTEMKSKQYSGKLLAQRMGTGQECIDLLEQGPSGTEQEQT